MDNEQRCGTILVVTVTPAKGIRSVTSQGKKLKKVKPGVYEMRDERTTIDVSWTPGNEVE